MTGETSYLTALTHHFQFRQYWCRPIISFNVEAQSVIDQNFWLVTGGCLGQEAHGADSWVEVELWMVKRRWVVLPLITGHCTISTSYTSLWCLFQPARPHNAKTHPYPMILMYPPEVGRSASNLDLHNRTLFASRLKFRIPFIISYNFLDNSIYYKLKAVTCQPQTTMTIFE